MEFTELFKPIKLGSLELKNRIGGCCTTTGGADIKGYVNENALATYAARSKGGAAVISIECTFASDLGAETTSFGNPRLSSRSYYAGMSELAETIQAFGARALIQITPGFGRQGSSKLSGKTCPAPSPIPGERPKDWDLRIMPRGYETQKAQAGATTAPRELTLDEIEWLEKQYPDAVAGARICGFDAVEVHSPHGYLIHEFLSPRSNQRTDKYGGSLENRMRFLRNIIINTRKRIGPDYPFGIRLSGDEHMPNGIHEEEMLIVAQEMEKEGIDWVHVSDGSYEARPQFFPQDPNCMINHAAAFKSVLKIPVLCPSVHDPYLAEKIIGEGKTDIVTLGRQLISDPEWPNKVKEGRIDDIVRCIRCNVCLARFNRGLQIRCVVNPNIGRERYSGIKSEYQRPPIPAKQPPCEAACPVGLDVHNYILMASRGQWDEAYRWMKLKLPFPGVIGRVCPHPCETECNRDKLEEPIAINSIKRAVSDFVMEDGLPEIAPVPQTKEMVAVVGSGPAGLTAAHDLVKKGYGVTVFESLSVPGGIMAVGIPEYRLPRKIVEMEIESIKKLGVEIKLNMPVGKDGLSFEDLSNKGYKAIFLAVGAHRSMKLGIKGEELEGVYQGLSFLKDVNLGKKVEVGKKVVVIGGGNVAMDVALTARRLGAQEVHMVCLEHSKEEMPAYDDDIEQAMEEDIKIEMAWGPRTILGSKGKVNGVEFKCCESVFDEDGKFNPLFNETRTKSIDADMVITAIGQTTDLSFLPEDKKFNITGRGTFDVDARSLGTNIPGVFVGGDAVRGPARMIDAIADGKRAAMAVDYYLRGENLPAEAEPIPLADIEDPTFKFHLRDTVEEIRYERAMLPVKDRASNFKEVNLCYDKETCIKEARRCINCRCTAMPY